MNIFKNKTAWKETLIKHLCIIAKLENSEDGIEGDIVAEAIKEFNINTERAIYIFDYPNKIESIYPTKEEDKLTYLSYLLKSIIANKVVSDIEKRSLFWISDKLEFDTNFLEKIVGNLELMTFEANNLIEYMDVEVEKILEQDILLLKNNNQSYSKIQLTEIYGKEGLKLLKNSELVFQEKYIEFFKKIANSEEVFHRLIGLSTLLIYTRCGINDNSKFFQFSMENLFIELTIIKKISQ